MLFAYFVDGYHRNTHTPRQMPRPWPTVCCGGSLEGRRKFALRRSFKLVIMRILVNGGGEDCSRAKLFVLLVRIFFIARRRRRWAYWDEQYGQRKCFQPDVWWKYITHECRTESHHMSKYPNMRCWGGWNGMGCYASLSASKYGGLVGFNEINSFCDANLRLLWGFINRYLNSHRIWWIYKV